MPTAMTFSQALAIGITGQVLYHVTQKLVAPGAHPVLSLLCFYAFAMVMCLPLLLLFPLTQPIGLALQEMNWAVIGVAVSIVLIELGFLLVYRVGGELSTTFVISSAVTTVATLVIGLGFFKETITPSKMIGVLLCVGGVVLLAKK